MDTTLRDSLWGRIAVEPAEAIAAARSHFAGLPTCRFSHASLFVEPEEGADLRLLAQVELQA